MKKICGMIVLILLCLFLPSTYASNTVNHRIQAKYMKTSDGDTARFEVDGENVRVRFLGINTPEVSGENKVEEPYGNEALAYTRQKLENAKKIEIEYDTVADKEDRYGRKLAWIWVDDELFELELLEKGLAKTYMLKNNYLYAAELKEAESKAKEAKIGVWNDEASQEVSEEKQVEQVVEEMVKSEETDRFSVESYIIIILVIFIISLLLKRKNKE